MTKTYILKEGSLHEKYGLSRNKIQFFGGGYGNGKTSAMIIKVLQIAKDYPGCNILVARSTYPKLNDTIRKTFIDFCPPEWIDSFPMSKNSENTCTLINGSKVNFRYISQRKGTEDGGSTSNLLSATYDLICVDQIEDPEIIHKDFVDLLGRLRGDTVYRGSDPTMPRTGPRWFLVAANPTRNWVYKQVIEPYHHFLKTGNVRDNLLCLRDTDTGKPLLDADGKVQLLLDVVEGSTYTNAHILSADFISTLESAYTGQMKDRFLKGEWAAYEGLVYPDFNSGTHIIRHDRLMLHLGDLIRRGVKLNWIEGYDHGLQSPSCYLLAAVDLHGNIFVVDGYYEKEAPIDWQATEIRRIRNTYLAKSKWINADPSLFRRAAAGGKVVGATVAEMFFEQDRTLLMQRGNNDITNGIRKVRSYLAPQNYHKHPITGEPGAPYLFVSDRLGFLEDEFQSYYWRTDSSGQREDVPVDRNDHALDALKYMLSNSPDAATLKPLPDTLPAFMIEWQESYSPYEHTGA